MAQWWFALRRRGKKSRSLQLLLRVECLEERNLLSSLVLVPSPQVSSGSLAGAAAIAANDIWAVGNFRISNGAQTLAEHFNGTSWSVVPTPSPTSNSFFSMVAKLA